jgi:hypothetical protein
MTQDARLEVMFGLEEERGGLQARFTAAEELGVGEAGDLSMAGGRTNKVRCRRERLAGRSAVPLLFMWGL